jgi:hypothetical protein
MARRVVVTGGTGFIGRTLVERLIERGYEVVVLSRNPARVSALFGGEARGGPWDGASAERWLSYADGAFGVVNLAGDNIAEGRWNAAKKERILRSRLDAGAAVLEAVTSAASRPAVVVQGSAVGYYGSRGEELLDELSAKGAGFLSNVCEAWERSTAGVESLGVRRVVIRTAPVLGARGGFLDRIVPIFRRRLGGVVGRGAAWMPWIELEDEVAAIVFLLEREDLAGAFNLSSPNAVRSREFYRTLARVLRRPAALPIPAFALRALLGEVANELVLAGQRVVPRRLLDAGFRFGSPELEAAFRRFL